MEKGLEIESRLFGHIWIKESKIITFVDGLVGFPSMRDFALIHDEEGFHLQGNYQGEDYNYFWPAKTLYSCHIEYEYLGKKGDCVDLNLPNDTFYIYPECPEFSVTKLSLATEELHQFILRKQEENQE